MGKKFNFAPHHRHGFMREDEKWMKKALRLAKRGRGRTSPNPMVGAVLVKKGRVIGEGYHQKAGEPHAEILALKQAGEHAKGATLYLNLEPCTHYGRTPPCTPSVIQSGVRRVVIGMKDPNPLVSGKGVESLKNAGIEVTVGILEKECQRLNEAFTKYIQTEEPFVILKVASTLDGKIATRNGHSKWISGEISRRWVHRLRDQVDGVVVGIETIIKDDPQLTSRIRGGRDPFRIVLDSRLRIPEESRVIKESPSRTILATTELAPHEKSERLEKNGVRILRFDSEERKVPLRPLLKTLGEMGMVSILVEGGSEVNGSFLNQGLIDKVFIFFSPKLMGDREAIGIFTGKEIKDLKEATLLHEIRIRRTGEDILLEGYIQKGGR